MLAGAAAPAAAVVWDNGPLTQGPAVLHALYRLAVRLAERAPLLLAVDDLQWCDPQSLRWLAYLVRRSERVPVVVMATRATGVGDHPALDDLCSLLGLVPLPAPSRQAVQAMAAELLGHPPDRSVLEAALHHTGGNAYLLSEHLAAGADPRSCPPAITRWVGDWLRQAGPGPLAAARAMAALDGHGEPDDVAVTARMDAAELPGALYALAEMGFLAGDSLRLAHPALRQAVLDGMPRGMLQGSSRS